MWNAHVSTGSVELTALHVACVQDRLTITIDCSGTLLRRPCAPDRADPGGSSPIRPSCLPKDHQRPLEQ
jgi:hypothetical protein